MLLRHRAEMWFLPCFGPASGHRQADQPGHSCADHRLWNATVLRMERLSYSPFPVIRYLNRCRSYRTADIVACFRGTKCSQDQLSFQEKEWIADCEQLHVRSQRGVLLSLHDMIASKNFIPNRFALRTVPGFGKTNEMGVHVMLEANRRIFLQSSAVSAGTQFKTLVRKTPK